MKKGISIHEWLNWAPLDRSGDYVWPPYKDFSQWGTTDDLAALRALGFDFIRLSIDPGPLLASTGNRQEEAIKTLEQATRILLAAGFKVILDLHPVSQVEAWSPKKIEADSNGQMAERYRGVVSAVAQMLTQFEPRSVAFELMNEPQYYPCEGAAGGKWKAVLKDLVRTARNAAPDLTLIVSGACGGGRKGLMLLDPDELDDDGLIYSFHYYTPLAFTHQGDRYRPDIKGAPWPIDAAALPRALKYSNDIISRRTNLTPKQRSERLSVAREHLSDYVDGEWNEERVQEHFREIVGWAERHNIPMNRLFVGEFGVLKESRNKGGALDADRLRWLRAVRHEAERYGIPWAFWEFSYFDPIAKVALGLDPEHLDGIDSGTGE